MMLQSESQQIQLVPYLEDYYEPLFHIFSSAGVHNTGGQGEGLPSPIRYNHSLRPDPRSQRYQEMY